MRWRSRKSVNNTRASVYGCNRKAKLGLNYHFSTPCTLWCFSICNKVENPPFGADFLRLYYNFVFLFPFPRSPYPCTALTRQPKIFHSVSLRPSSFGILAQISPHSHSQYPCIASGRDGIFSTKIPSPVELWYFGANLPSLPLAIPLYCFES